MALNQDHMGFSSMTLRIFCILFCRENSFSTLVLAAFPLSDCNASDIAAAVASASPYGTKTPASPTTSGRAPLSVTTGTHSQAIASASATPNDSR
ncbi:MAG: hypothetical protein PWQ30_422 [Euryarchaeota archaeon]|nr:hypothetical protein [Euryarchaeota archaeon]